MLPSLEMRANQFMARWMCAASGADFEDYRRGKVTEEQNSRAAVAGQELVALGDRLEIFDPMETTPESMAALIRRADARSHVDLVVLDYLGLLKLRDPSRKNVYLGEASRMLKMLANETNICVLALHQMNREMEKRPNPIPNLADLRDSGSLEQDADGVLFCVIPHKFESDRLEPGVEAKTDPDQLLALVRKNRDGKTPDVVLRFDRKHQSITEVALHHQAGPDGYPHSWDAVTIQAGFAGWDKERN